MSKSRFFCGGSALAVTLVLSVGAQSAVAQQTKPATPPEETTVTEVITTGTFIRGAAEDAALPVEVTTREELEKQGNPTVNELVRTMSEIGNIQGEDNRNSGNAPGVGTINLRNMGSGRTLVLLNGQRLASQSSPFTNGDTQDTTVIPSEVLQQVEVLKDGGSTTYGSDAVAGVVNFKTRTDLNGMEASASYKYVKGSDGDYNGSIQWGRRNDSGNVLLSVAYDHRSELRADQRDFVDQPFLYNIGTGGPGLAANGGWTQTSNPGSYNFFAAPGTGLAVPAGVPTFSNLNALNIRANAAVAAGGSVLADGGATGSYAGTVRDPLCNQLGGFRGFSGSAPFAALGVTTTVVPVCLTNFITAENLVQTTDVYRVFADANFDVSDKWRVNMGFNFSKTVLPHRVYSGVAGMTQSGGAVSPCDPYDPFVTMSANPQVRNCVPQQGTNGVPTSAATQYYVSGYNPALYQFMNTARTDAGVRYFTDAQVAQVASCLPGTSAGYCAAIGQDTPGRGQMRVTGNGASMWSPFGLAGNPAFDDLRASERNENTQLMTTATLKGTLGELFGSAIDMRLSGTYTRNFIDTSGKGILVDRLQRALNGYATNLNDRSRADGSIDRCTAGETYGQRPGAYTTTSTVVDNTTNIATGTTTTTSAAGVITTVRVTGPNAGGGQVITTVQTPILTPFSVNAGGGWGDANGAADGTPTNAGNGCYFFNPYASAIAGTVFGQQTYTNRVGSNTTYGFVGTGQYQGYGTAIYNSSGGILTAPNSGLQNDIGVINWLYENRYSRSQQDTMNVQLVFNGVGGIDLPGGPLAWAGGGEYRYYRRNLIYDSLSNLQQNPCTFISTLTGTRLATRAQDANNNDLNVPGRQAITGAITENYTVACNNVSQTNAGLNTASRTGVWLDGFGGSESLRTNKVVSAFGELSLPLLESVSAQLQTRYEKATDSNSGRSSDAAVSSAAVRWRINEALTLRASGSQTFDATDCNCDPGLTSASNTSVLTGTGLTVTVDPLTQRNTYGNVAINPETGFNYSFGLVYRPTPSFEFQAQLANIEVKGRPQAISANDIARNLVGRGGLGATLTDDSFTQVLDCSNPIFSTIDPASGAPLVQLVGVDGTVANACQAGATGFLTLNGLDAALAVPGGGANGGGGNPGGGLPTQNYALLFNLPNVVNSGNQSTRQLDLSANYRLPKTILGGVTTVGMDISYLFFLNQDPAIYGNSIVDAGGKYKGVYASATSFQTPSSIRGSLGVTWQKDKNTVTVTERFVSDMTDLVSSSPVVAQSTSTGYTNYNPASNLVANCTLANINALIPDARVSVAALGTPGIGEGPVNNACNVGNYTGEKIQGAAITDVTVIRQLAGNATLTFTVNNLFDIDPPYMRTTQYYFPSGTVTSLGRTVKVGVRKKF